ncbi:unnamed protein product [Sphagnum jensenii]|uniref:AP2/ERF domain-containing protein n=1 Tax=Sphagnum jensenii TaxID=128206 RepID=A0ABP0X7M3_9BRYO
MVSIRKRRPSGLSPASSLPQPLNQLYAPNLFPKGISAYQLPATSFSLLQAVESNLLSSAITLWEVWTSDYNLKSPHAERELKKRKRQRRKQQGNQEPCVMRGVYFKNMKWQAAIKVEKKQVHLGTVGSQEEAARLYDRAAYMCGREPNFELSEEDKQELQRFQWDEFLELTRKSILNKSKVQSSGVMTSVVITLGVCPSQIVRHQIHHEYSDKLASLPSDIISS